MTEKMPIPETESFAFNVDSRRTMLCVILDSPGIIERCGEEVVIRLRDPIIYERAAKVMSKSTILIAPDFDRMHSLLKNLPD